MYHKSSRYLYLLKYIFISKQTINKKKIIIIIKKNKKNKKIKKNKKEIKN